MICIYINKKKRGRKRSGADCEVHKENVVSGGGNVGNIPKINKYWKEWLGIPNVKITWAK